MALAALLSIGHLAYLTRHFMTDRAWVTEYRALAAAIPLHGRVLTSYTHLPYNPLEEWYGAIPRPRIDWRRVTADYDFLLITKPYDPRVLAVPTRPLAGNSTATLLEIVK